MSRCDAVVVEASGREVWVEVPGRAPSCGSCTNTNACQDGFLDRSAGLRRYRLENSIGARVGDQVKLTVAEGVLLRAALLSYGLPVLLAIAGAAVGQTMAGDGGGVSGTLAGLFVGLVLLRRKEMLARRSGKLFSLDVQTRKVLFKENHE